MADLDLDAIEADQRLAVQMIPGGDVTTEPGAGILAARLRLQEEHVPALLARMREMEKTFVRGTVDYSLGKPPYVHLSVGGSPMMMGYVVPDPSKPGGGL